MTTNKISPQRLRQLRELEKKLGYQFKSVSLLDDATCHNSYLYDGQHTSPRSYERLEFVGDLVLGCIIGDYLYHAHPQLAEGEYTRIKAQVVSRKSLEMLARKIQIGEYLLLSRGEECTGGRNRASILSCAMEAIIGAVFIDSGYDKSRDFVLMLLRHDVEELIASQSFTDYKSQLQEYQAKLHLDSPQYQVVNAEGPDHAPEFTVQVALPQGLVFRAKGYSKKEAEKEAAKQAMVFLESRKKDTVTGSSG